MDIFEKKEPYKTDFCKAVIFDMDGTLVDSTKADFLAWRKLFSHYDRELTFQDYIPLLGIKSAQVVKDFLPVKNDEEVQFALTKKLVFFHEIISENGIYPVPFADIFPFKKSAAAFCVMLSSS